MMTLSCFFVYSCDVSCLLHLQPSICLQIQNIGEDNIPDKITLLRPDGFMLEVNKTKLLEDEHSRQTHWFRRDGLWCIAYIKGQYTVTVEWNLQKMEKTVTVKEREVHSVCSSVETVFVTFSFSK